jgi:hypothetical protein
VALRVADGFICRSNTGQKLPVRERNVIKCYVTAAPGASANPPPWAIVITEWALDSYLDLKYRGVFTPQEYRSTLRPDVMLLKGGMPPRDPKFQAHTFWGPAKQGNRIIHGGYKMKWHQIGPGKVNLRLPVTPLQGQVLLCECYEKRNAAYEQRKLALFKVQINLIAAGRYTHRGTL